MVVGTSLKGLIQVQVHVCRSKFIDDIAEVDDDEEEELEDVS